MKKTKVDDFLIEMISPKIKEIEEKFSNSEPLSQDDINTLLLKAQFNHINHLDEKLDEVTRSVTELEYKFKSLEQKVENDFKSLEQKVESDFESLKQKVESDFKSLKQEVNSEINLLREEFKRLEEKIESTIQKALNKNMMLLIIVIGFFMTLSKIIDKIFK